MESRELQQGTLLSNGKYTIENKIGEGGFSITYKAVQNGLDRTVCIKEYFPAGKCVRNTQAKTVHLQGISEDVFEKYRLQFVKEAKTLANLKHPNIVEVIDVFDENNTSYMVMPFIEGQTLQALVDQKGMLDYEQTVNYLGQIAEAVGYIHSLPIPILHRDIKPENIIITPDYHAILIDFGSAREFEHDKTQRQTSILTKGYAPWEQYSTVSRKGSYTDIYSLGATYYFAMTGKEPLDAASRNDTEIPPMPEPKSLNPHISNNVNRTILKAMAMRTENRHQNIEEFLDDLYGKRPSEPIKDENVVIVGPSHKWLWIKLITVLIFGGMIAGFVTYNNAEKLGKINAQAKVVRDSISLENVYWDKDMTNANYHLFHNCNTLLDPVSEGTVEQVFDNHKTQLCQECVNKVADYKFYRKEARDCYNAAIKLLDGEYFQDAEKYFQDAWDNCNKALEMRPDDKRMNDIAKEIRSMR